jgi:hypothetical protein
MRLTVAANAFQVHGVRDSLTAGVLDGIAGLVGTFVNTQLLAAKGEHLGHERQIVEAAVLVKRGKNLFPASDLNQFTSLQSQTSWNCYATHSSQ